ncbi:hypothetical protein SAMN05421819_1910 [Bryocella elongata]|uniref:Uncharacterized protein n=1 Tax=Bryocella elongata TaxID=863522 RepID=A0A1H5XP89_9BACT|nr:hypothetical protein [Bryocella elongata]SEG13579.1 hypothetical protein SAMN05421819_1910 [Bryocella elongata]
MTDLHQALTDIRSIRRQVAQTTEFRGYGPATLSATALLALLAAAAQSHWLPTPAAHPVEYVALWLSTAVLCAALIATQMLTRANHLHGPMADEMIRLAVLQFLPAAAAGAILPVVLLHALLHASPIGFWMLPGLWQVIFSLGVFASVRCMPRSMVLVGLWFLLTGFSCLWLGDNRALSPAWMGLPYGLGMALVAVLHRSASHRTLALEDGEEDLDDEA